MKKAGISALVIIAVIMVSFTVGFYLGRNINSEPIIVTASASPMECSFSSISSERSTTTSSETEVPDTPRETSESSDTETSVPTSLASKTESDKLNINTASASQLMELPGIGDVIAARIIEYREVNGPFSSLDELDNVEGIGEKRLDDLKDYATVGG